METEVALPSPAVDFNFDSACTSPYVSCPSSPQRFGNFFFSAPTSPTRASSFYSEFNSFSRAGSRGSLSTIPFNWEEKPGIPKAKDNTGGDDENDFEFDFSGGQFERTSLSADELFDGGKIKPLKPPPGLQVSSDNGLTGSPKSPRKFFREALSPRSKKKDFDPFEAAIEQTRRERNPPQDDRNEQKQQQNPERGRQRLLYDSSSASSNIGHKGTTRSLSPFRVCDIFFESESNQQSSNSSISSKSEAKQTSSSSSSSSLSLFSSSSWRGYKKWNLKDLLLFRSASEGRATSKDQLKKYSLLKKSGGEDDVKNSSFRSTESGRGSVSLRRRGTASAHELHYTANRAVSEEMRRKTFLPYKHGLLGCLGFNPAVQDISRGLGSLTRG